MRKQAIKKLNAACAITAVQLMTAKEVFAELEKIKTENYIV